MKTLSNVEIELIDKYMLKEQVSVISPAHIAHAISNTVPTFRAEQLSTIDEQILLTEYLESFK